MTRPRRDGRPAACLACHSEAHTGACSWTTPSRAEESCICLGTIFILVLLCAPACAAASPARQVPDSRPTANLAPNGTFDQADPAGRLPAGWTTKHPDNVKRVNVGGPRGWVIEMTGDKDLMATYGTDLVSPKIPVKPNTRYRCTGYTKSAGPKMIVFVKGYATITRRTKGRQETAEDVVYQMRKEIDPAPDWQPFNLDFEIRPTGEFSPFQHRIEYLRITLWAYWPEGTCWYDDIRFEEVGPAPPDQQVHSRPVTHLGVKPRLAETQPAATPSAGTRPDFDEQQAWLDATNAWQEERYEDALKLSLQLLAHDPGRADYRVLAARAAAQLGLWLEADQHAQWLLARSSPTASQPSRQVEPWQQDWARIVHADVLLHTNRPEEARRILQDVSQTATSPHARAAAQHMLDEP